MKVIDRGSWEFTCVCNSHLVVDPSDIKETKVLRKRAEDPDLNDTYAFLRGFRCPVCNAFLIGQRPPFRLVEEPA